MASKPHRSKKANAPKQPTRRDEARALFRNAILDAAEEVFSERGFHVARCQDVASRARIAVGTIYNHFGQKEDVLRALIEERSEQLTAAIRAHDDDPRVFEERLARRIERFLAYVAAHRGFFALALEHGLLGGPTATAKQVFSEHKLAHMERFRAALRTLVADGARDGVLAESLDRDLAARFLGATLRAMAMQTVAEAGAGKTDHTASARLAASLFLHGAAGAGEGAGGARGDQTNSSRRARKTSSSA